MHVQIELLRQAHFQRLRHLFDAICRERRFLAFTEAGAVEKTFAHYGDIKLGGWMGAISISIKWRGSSDFIPGKRH